MPLLDSPPHIFSWTVKIPSPSLRFNIFTTSPRGRPLLDISDMATNENEKEVVEAPPPVPPKPRVSRSFSRLEDAKTENASRTGVEVLTAANASMVNDPLSPREEDSHSEVEDGEKGTAPQLDGAEGLADEGEVTAANLPAEIVELIDKFIDSLTQPIHPAPLSIGPLSNLFQDFYVKASPVAYQVAFKIYAPSSSRPVSAKTQQMISISEMAEKKNQRKLVELKARAFEEAIEEAVTQKLYEKIWRHKTADDEARDESLRSKTMALGVVGVGLKEFGLDELIDRKDLASVTEALQRMDSVRFPCSKIVELKHAHKAIVDSLSKKKGNGEGRTMSADHILPALIYSIMISPPEINAISNLLFVQRFRARKYVDGESAYCLTNFEAAISFLENVDLESLLGEGQTVGSSKIYDTENFDPLLQREVATFEQTSSDPLSASPKPALSSSSSPKPAAAKVATTTDTTNPPPPTPSRRTPFLAPVEFATSAATSAVNTADQSIKTIGSTLESSYKFFFGKMSDRKTEIPRTLDDARNLVGTPTSELEAGNPTGMATDANAKPTASAPEEPAHAANTGSSITLPFGLFGTPMQRVNSSDSVRSKGSATSSTNPGAKTTVKEDNASDHNDRGLAGTPVGVAAEGVRNLGNHLGRLAGNINPMRSFSSRAQVTRTASQPQPLRENELEPHSPAAPPVDLLNTFPDLAGILVADNSSASLPVQIAPPDTRFLKASAEDLKMGEIPDLLKEYQRLAEYLDKLGAFSESS